MDREMKDWILAESYVSQELTGKALEAVVQRIESDKAFAQLVSECEVILSGTSLAVREQIRESLKEIEQESPLLDEKTWNSPEVESTNDPGMEETIERRLEKIRYQAIEKLTEKGSENASLWRRMGWRPIAAAVFLLVVAVGFWLWKPQPEYQRIARQYFKQPEPILNVSRGNDVVFDQLLRKAMDAYVAKQYKKAGADFEQLVTQYQHVPSRFYLGISQLRTGKTQQAIRNLEFFNNNSEDIRFERVDYYLALAYLQAGELEQAKQILDQAEDPDSQALRQAITNLSDD